MVCLRAAGGRRARRLRPGRRSYRHCGEASEARRQPCLVRTSSIVSSAGCLAAWPRPARRRTRVAPLDRDPGDADRRVLRRWTRTSSSPADSSARRRSAARPGRAPGPGRTGRGTSRLGGGVGELLDLGPHLIAGAAPPQPAECIRAAQEQQHSGRAHGAKSSLWSDGARAAAGRARAPDRRSARVGHRPLQLPLPVLHARRGPALAGASRDPHLRGDHPAGRCCSPRWASATCA